MKEKNKTRQVTLIIIISIVLIFFFSGFSIGKEFSKTTLEGTGGIAQPILKVENNKPVNINSKNNKGIYEFKVKNYDEKNITQVDLEYYIEILSDINKNISVKIYKDDKVLDINNKKTETFLITKDKKQEDNYKIEIVCNKNVAIEEIMQEIQVKVHSEQKRT